MDELSKKPQLSADLINKVLHNLERTFMLSKTLRDGYECGIFLLKIIKQTGFVLEVAT